MADGDHAHAPAPLAPAPAPIAVPIAAPIPIVRAAPLRPAPVVVAAPLRPAPVIVAAPAPAYGPAPVPAYGPPQVVYQDTPPAYDFSYGVQGDSYTGSASFGHNENRNGYTTNGEYRVALPDGRTQVVTYNVLDAQSGYVADVKYEGQPIAYAAPAPAYGPAPIVPAYGRGPILVAN